MIVRLRAIWDLEDASSWYESKREDLGAEFLSHVADAFRRIEQNPKLHAVVHKSRIEE